MTIGAEKSAPMTNADTTTIHTAVAAPMTRKGTQATPHITFITVR